MTVSNSHSLTTSRSIVDVYNYNFTYVNASMPIVCTVAVKDKTIRDSKLYPWSASETGDQARNRPRDQHDSLCC